MQHCKLILQHMARHQFRSTGISHLIPPAGVPTSDCRKRPLAFRRWLQYSACSPGNPHVRHMCGDFIDRCTSSSQASFRAGGPASPQFMQPCVLPGLRTGYADNPVCNDNVCMYLTSMSIPYMSDCHTHLVKVQHYPFRSSDQRLLLHALVRSTSSLGLVALCPEPVGALAPKSSSLLACYTSESLLICSSVPWCTPVPCSLFSLLLILFTLAPSPLVDPPPLTCLTPTRVCAPLTALLNHDGSLNRALLKAR